MTSKDNLALTQGVKRELTKQDYLRVLKNKNGGVNLDQAMKDMEQHGRARRVSEFIKSGKIA